MSPRDELLSFQGRLRRRDWWIFGIATGATQLLCTLVIARTVGIVLVDAALARPWTPGWFVVTGPSAVFTWPNLALAVKRGHDRSIAAPWSIALMLVSYAAGYAPEATGSRFDIIWSLIVLAASLLAVVVLGVLAGTPHANRYGPSPKAPDAVGDVFS